MVEQEVRGLWKSLSGLGRESVCVSKCVVDVKYETE